MSTIGLPILDQAATLADLTRCRILRVLGRQELTVGELCSVLQLPQSTVSRHLKILTDGGWLRPRKEGTRNLYRLLPDRLDDGARRLWRLIREQMTDTASDIQDGQRLEDVLHRRRSRSQAFFSSAADRWDQVRGELFGDRFDLLAMLGLLDRRWHVGDLACGTGQIAAALAPFVRGVVAVDNSPAMLAAARDRLDRLDHVRVLEGELEALPIDDDALDVATLFLALHHVPDLDRALVEARRVLRPDGRLLVVDMMPHDREAYREDMGHVWLGFSADDINRSFTTAGFTEVHYQPLPTEADTKGPGLFVAVATRPRWHDEQPARPTSTTENPTDPGPASRPEGNRSQPQELSA